MAQHTPIEFSKTYATEANAHAAVAKVFGDNNDVRYFLVPVWDNKVAKTRFGVVCIGHKAIEAGAHFHFNVVA